MPNLWLERLLKDKQYILINRISKMKYRYLSTYRFDETKGDDYIYEVTEKQAIQELMNEQKYFLIILKIRYIDLVKHSLLVINVSIAI